MRRRFDPAAQATKGVAEKQLGSISLVRVTSRAHPPPPEELLVAEPTETLLDEITGHDVVGTDISRAP